MKNIFAMCLGLILGGSLAFLSSGCTPDYIRRTSEMRDLDWYLCAADRIGSAGCRS